MKTYKLIIAYDGSGYCGWQSQPDKASVAGALEDAFAQVFKKKVIVLGASRTDAGVHALGQVARIKTDLAIDTKTLQWAWNNALSGTIIIRSLELVDQVFSPFCAVKQKTYYYHFFLKRPLPFIQKYGYYFPFKADLHVLQQALECFVGTHDFAAFRSIEDTRENTVRTIDSISLEYIRRYNVYRIVVKGQKFLRHMIRRIVGASLAVASRDNFSVETIKKAIKSCDPAQTLPNAPAQGLMLYKIRYTK
jgi:tRNA pseudouridine38-40 synthase